MSGYIPSKLDADQVLRRAYDETENRLRVDAEVTATIGTVDVVIDATQDNIAIADPTGTNFLQPNPDGSINANIVGSLDVEISAADGDNIAISDGTDTLAINTDGSINTKSPEIELILQDLLTELEQKTEPSQAQNIRQIDGFTTVTPDSVQLVGSINGTASGTKYGFVNNIRQQILASQDREQSITYADFGTKDQRVTRIEYSSSTFPGFTLRKDLLYTLVGTRYRRDDINWSVI